MEQRYIDTHQMVTVQRLTAHDTFLPIAYPFLHIISLISSASNLAFDTLIKVTKMRKTAQRKKVFMTQLTGFELN